jgi:hypothetical protein
MEDIAIIPEKAETNLFLIEQYKALRTEIDYTMVHSRQLIFGSVAACGALWSFIIINCTINNSVIYWVPSIIAVFSCLYSLALRNNLKKIGEFLISTEKELLKDKSTKLGWESHIKQNWPSRADIWENAFWLSFLFINLLGALMIEPNTIYGHCSK